MNKYKDKAITIIQTLINAAGAEFEDQNMAIDIISDNLEKELKINVGLADVRLSLVEVDKDILKICKDAFADGEKITAVKCLIEEVNKTYYKFGIKEASDWLKGNEA